MAWMREKTRRLIQIQPMPVHDFYDLIYIFVIGGLLSTIYEVFLILALHGVLEGRSGSILTPFNYVYGFGAVAIFLVMYRLIFWQSCVIPSGQAVPVLRTDC